MGGERVDDRAMTTCSIDYTYLIEEGKCRGKQTQEKARSEEARR